MIKKLILDKKRFQLKRGFAICGKSKKIRVGVVMGGPSVEYSVSLNSGKNVLHSLDKNRYVARRILISKTGLWPMSFVEIKKKFDVLFLALHGEYGEDGQVQALLDNYGVRYIGSGAYASKIGMDKVLSARIFRRGGLLVPDFILLKKKFSRARIEKLGEKAIRKFSLPVIIKPADRGSSIGLYLASDRTEFASAIKAAFKFSDNILLQEFINGKEFTCGVLEIDGAAIALPLTEIIPKSKRLFDYEAKYTAGVSEEITPAKVPAKNRGLMQNIALAAYRSIGASGYSRIDMIMDKNGVIYVLEINTLPGLTRISLVPQEAAAACITFSKLLDYIIDAALIKQYNKIKG